MSRNTGYREKYFVPNVTPRKGRVSRNDVDYILGTYAESRLARGV